MRPEGTAHGLSMASTGEPRDGDGDGDEEEAEEAEDVDDGDASSQAWSFARRMGRAASIEKMQRGVDNTATGAFRSS